MTEEEIMRRSITRQIKKSIDDMRQDIFKTVNDRLKSMQYQITEFRRYEADQINLLTDRLFQIAEYENKLIDEINRLKNHDTR